jgi:hypothetical protein
VLSRSSAPGCVLELRCVAHHDRSCLLTRYLWVTDDEGAIAEPNPDQGMQDKLVAAWDCLQVCAALCLLL